MLRAWAETTNANFIAFRLTRSGFEPTIYRTRGEHANHYTTDTVKCEMKQKKLSSTCTTKLNAIILIELTLYYYTKTFSWRCLNLFMLRQYERKVTSNRYVCMNKRHFYSYPVDFQRTEHASYISKTADHENLLMGHSTCFVYEYIERFIQLNAWKAPESRSWLDSILYLGM